jgi:osmotically inducible lipoprotein OsmB
MNMKHLAAVALATVGAFALNSCETATGTGALVGASTGALIGSSVSGGHHGYYHNGGNAGGALAGAAIGAGAGALIGAAIDADQRGYYEGHQASYYAYGQRTGTSGLLRSPYPPYALVDVRGVPRGALVRDPASGRPFRRP